MYFFRENECLLPLGPHYFRTIAKMFLPYSFPFANQMTKPTLGSGFYQMKGKWHLAKLSCN
jgi:hypothetical protein